MVQFAGNARWAEPSQLFAHRARPNPINCKNKYLMFALGEKTAAQAIVGSGRFAGWKSQVRRRAPTVCDPQINRYSNLTRHRIAIAKRFFVELDEIKIHRYSSVGPTESCRIKRYVGLKMSSYAMFLSFKTSIKTNREDIWSNEAIYEVGDVQLGGVHCRVEIAYNGSV